MRLNHSEPVGRLLIDLLGAVRARHLLETLRVHEDTHMGHPGTVDAATLASALAALLFDDILRRVPMASAYVEDQRRAGRRLLLDHGALRTVDANLGALPRGRAAFARILEPLGYECRATYDLASLKMTGFAYTHRVHPETIPQYFVSELHTDRFDDPDFTAAVGRVVGSSRDPLSASAVSLLGRLSAEGRLPHECAVRLLPELVACFDRQHATPTLSDYELLRERSAEMAWIATEGNAFNHATDRVDDVATVAEAQRRLGRPIKDQIEVSSSGRVLQTAFRAARIERTFLDDDGHVVLRSVPGSFHEFISRRRLPDGSLDLAFDASNAQGIFGMTDAGLAG